MNLDLYICRECGRKLPNYKWFTKNGCIWCDSEYHIKKNSCNIVFNQVCDIGYACDACPYNDELKKENS